MAMVEKIKNKLRGNGFLLAVTIVLFFVFHTQVRTHEIETHKLRAICLNLFLLVMDRSPVSCWYDICTDQEESIFRLVPSMVKLFVRMPGYDDGIWPLAS